MRSFAALALVLLGCGGEAAAPATPPPEEALAALRADAARLLVAPEHHDQEVTIQHCLVGVKGHGTQSARSAAEAEALAAEVYARARAGEDFDLLVKNHSDDTYPCRYTMALGPAAPPGGYLRAQVGPPLLGDTAWRLAVGELGVAAFDGDASAPRSPYGWHVVKRVK